MSVSSLAGSDVPAESLQVFHEAFAGDDSTGVILLAVVLQFAILDPRAARVERFDGLASLLGQ